MAQFTKLFLVYAVERKKTSRLPWIEPPFLSYPTGSLVTVLNYPGCASQMLTTVVTHNTGFVEIRKRLEENFDYAGGISLYILLKNMFSPENLTHPSMFCP